MSGDSPTGFDSGAFTAGAVGGAAIIAAAIGAGLASVRAQQQNRWDGWTIYQLQTALNLTEARLNGTIDNLREANARIAQLERAAADRAFIFRREAARSLRAR